MASASLLRGLFAFLAAVALGYTLGCLAATQGALMALPAIAQPIPFDVRLDTMRADLAGMLSYAALMALALAGGFSVARTLLRWLPALRPIAYPLAGFAAVIALHPIMTAALDGIVAVAATRTLSGLLAQGCAGALAGALFGSLTRPRAQPTG